jgi:uncharacterized repeat protein (TIGR03803 family)
VDGFVSVFNLALTLALLVLPGGARGQGIEQTLYSFGFSDAAYPRTPLIQGIDGALYGTTGDGGTDGYGTVFMLSTNGSGYQVLYSFTDGKSETPGAWLVQGTDGALYGTTPNGGPEGNGTVFKLSTNGSGYQVLHSFTGTDGANPYAGLVQGADGALYGTSYVGGTNGLGAAFKLRTDGSGYQVLHSFSNAGVDGYFPEAPLVQGADGALYGTTSYGGTNGNGTVFKLNPDGSGYQMLSSIPGVSLIGGAVPSGLVQGADGALYGITSDGGTNDHGTVFKLSPNGSGYQVLHNFTGTGGDGGYPNAGLVQGTDGALYGTTYDGGTHRQGTVFKLGTDGSGYQVLYSFAGINTDAGLVQGADGALYGTSYSGGTGDNGTVFKLGTDGSGYQVLYSFTGIGTDGSEPAAGLVQGADGALYGTTSSGGTNNNGTVFKVSPNGSGYQVLYSFTLTGGDAGGPVAGLAQGADGSLYGTASAGGTNYSGTVFKLGRDGSGYRVLYRFTGTGGDGSDPGAGLVQGTDGALYGTTSRGGINNNGTVFKLNPDGSGYSVIHSFTNSPGGAAGPAGLVQGADGALYGTAAGGTNNHGTVFKLSPDGSGYQVLHSFTDSPGAGADPNAGLVQGADGALYGTTIHGGTNIVWGTVFKLNPNGSGFQVLYSFDRDSNPYAGLVQGAEGTLYGTTYGRTSSVSGEGYGTVFALSTSGSGFQVLYSFADSGGDGGGPSGLVQGGDGALYGTTSYGGAHGNGTVFRVISGQLPAGSLLISLASDRNVQLSFVPPFNAASQINVSSNLVNWAPLTNLPASLGPVYFVDRTATNYPKRFYRAVWSP